MNKKESVICEFEMDFKKSYDIISVLCKHVMLRSVTTSTTEIWDEF